MFGTETDELSKQETLTDVQLQIVYAGQLALAANGNIRYVKLGQDHPLAWLIEKMKADPTVKDDFAEASRFGMRIWLQETAMFSTGLGAERLANNRVFHSILDEELELPEFDSLSEDDDDDADKGEAGDEKLVAPKGFLHEWEFTAWSIRFPLLLDAAVEPLHDYLDKAVAETIKSAVPNAPLLRMMAAGGDDEFFQQLAEMQRTEALDLALSSLVRKRYRQAIERLLFFEKLLPPDAALDHVQTKYIEAMCYRGLQDEQHEEMLLKSASEELRGLRRLAATRSASLRLNDLRQMISEEYFSLLYRDHNWTGMAAAMGEYHSASLLPAAVLAEAPGHPLAQELKTLRDTYDSLNEDAHGHVDSPVTRQDYQKLLQFFNAPERLPYDDPTLNAIEQATYMVTDELYARVQHTVRKSSAIRPAAPDELLILLAVGKSGIHMITIDEHSRVTGYYRYIPLSRLESLSRTFKENVSNNGSFQDSGTQLYDLLFAYLPELKGKRRISILPDGPLQGIPWGALAGSNGRYLIEDYEIGILSGVSAVSGGTMSGNIPVLVISNPDLDSTTEKGDDVSKISGLNVSLLQPAEPTILDVQHALRTAEDVYISTHGISGASSPGLLVPYSAGRQPSIQR